MNNSDRAKSDHCNFCTETISANAFYSDTKFSAIYNIAPVLPGHSLIIPNSHYKSLFELPETELGEMMIFARKITKMLLTVFNCTGFDWTVQDGISAGQTVPHLHLHIIPRKANDLPEGEEWYSKISENEYLTPDSNKRNKLSSEEYLQITSMLKQAVATTLQ